MPTYIVEIEELTTYRMTVEADSESSARGHVWNMLEDGAMAEDIAQVHDAGTQSVRARPRFDFEEKISYPHEVA